MSECLAKSAQKIDFGEEDGEEKGKTTSEEDTEDKEKEASSFQPSLWPWDSVRNKLKYVKVIYLILIMYQLYNMFQRLVL